MATSAITVVLVLDVPNIFATAETVALNVQLFAPIVTKNVPNVPMKKFAVAVTSVKNVQVEKATSVTTVKLVLIV